MVCYLQNSAVIMTVNCYNKEMMDKKYTIEQLSEKTGFSKRTIRYYIQEGLLAAPAGRGRGGFYFDSHLHKLYQIKSLQEKGMKLASIVDYFKEKKEVASIYRRDIWVKYEILPGLEISVEKNLEEQEKKKVFEIIRVAKSIMQEKNSE